MAAPDKREVDAWCVGFYATRRLPVVQLSGEQRNEESRLFGLIYSYDPALADYFRDRANAEISAGSI